MEAIFGLIEDLIERANGSDPDDAADAKLSLKNNKNEFIKNLEDMVQQGNAEAAKLLEKLKALDL
ncbi:MAG: hypothetical protein ACTSU2_01600 [Promethearchaeota archaeon]